MHPLPPPPFYYRRLFLRFVLFCPRLLRCGRVLSPTARGRRSPSRHCTWRSATSARSSWPAGSPMISNTLWWRGTFSSRRFRSLEQRGEDNRSKKCLSRESPFFASWVFGNCSLYFYLVFRDLDLRPPPTVNRERLCHRQKLILLVFTLS